MFVNATVTMRVCTCVRLNVCTYASAWRFVKSENEAARSLT